MKTIQVQIIKLLKSIHKFLQEDFLALLMYYLSIILFLGANIILIYNIIYLFIFLIQ